MNTITQGTPEYVVEFEYGWQEEPEVVRISRERIDAFLARDENSLRESIAFYLAFCAAQTAENAFSDVSSEVFTAGQYEEVLKERELEVAHEEMEDEAVSEEVADFESRIVQAANLLIGLRKVSNDV